MRRRLFALALFLLLGAVVNVAVAWGCILTLPTELHLTNERTMVRREVRGGPSLKLHSKGGHDAPVTAVPGLHQVQC